MYCKLFYFSFYLSLTLFLFQRYVLLYGVGKARDEARAAVKKLTKEICKLFSKKCSIDIAEGKGHLVHCFHVSSRHTATTLIPNSYTYLTYLFVAMLSLFGKI